MNLKKKRDDISLVNSDLSKTRRNLLGSSDHWATSTEEVLTDGICDAHSVVKALTTAGRPIGWSTSSTSRWKPISTKNLWLKTHSFDVCDNIIDDFFYTT